MKDCLFCKIINGEIPCYKIYEDGDVIAFLDVAGDFYGHTLVVPKKHCENMVDADSNIVDKLFAAVQKISKSFINEKGFDGVNVFTNIGQASGQSIMHLHIHVIPRKNNDGFQICPQGVNNDFNLVEIKKILEIK